MITSIKQYIKNILNRRRMTKRGLIGKRHASEPAIIEVAEHSRVLSIFMMMLIWAVCTVVLTFPIFYSISLNLIEGQQAPQTIFAKDNFNYENVTETKRLRQEAADSEPLCFNVSTADNEAIFLRFTSLQNEVEKTRETPPNIHTQPFLASLSPQLLHSLRIIFDAPEIMEGYRASLEHVLGAGIISSTLRKDYKLAQPIRILDSEQRDRAPKPVEEILTSQRAAKQVTNELLAEYPVGGDEQELSKVLMTITESIIGVDGNIHFDEKRTALRKHTAAALIKPVWIEVLKGEPLVVRNDTVEAETKNKLIAYEKFLRDSVTGKIMLRRMLSNAFSCFLMVILLAVGVWCVKPEVVKNNRYIALGGLILTASLLLNYFMVKVFSFFSGIFDIQQFFIQDAIPVALAAAVILPILGIEVAIFAAMFLAGVSTLMLMPEPELFFKILLSYICCGVAVSFSVKRATNYRLYFLRIVITVFLILFVLDFNNSALTNFSVSGVIQSGTLCFVNGLITAISALLMIFIFELVFNVSTDMSLLLQCDINHPLLKELQLKAPGTSYHSQIVATLAETAAKLVGANPLKCRVGALFHDIGKLKKPEYFTENNIGTANMHEDLNPAMSAIILRSHVEDGVELARQYKLSKLVRDMIQQHHGTDIMRFFYNKAMQANVTVLEAQFSYPGPRPRKKEVVIVSMADACEAATRSLTHPTSQNITAMVNDIFRHRMESGQLDRAEITVAELGMIKESFIRTLTTMFHSRIAYPQTGDDKNEAKLQMADKKTPRA